METSDMRIGELARLADVSVRTLHHYHEIGLLEPTRHTAGSQRLYSAADAERLRRIKSLRQLGLSLDEIKDCLDGTGASLRPLVSRHLGRLDEQIDRQRRIRARLALAIDYKPENGLPLDELLAALESAAVFEKYYSADQLDALERRRHELGQERIEEVQREWARLFKRFAEEHSKGTDAANDEVATLARQARVLVEEFTRSDAGIAQSLGRMYEQEGAGNVLGRAGFPVAPETCQYMHRAMAALHSGPSKPGAVNQAP